MSFQIFLLKSLLAAHSAAMIFLKGAGMIGLSENIIAMSLSKSSGSSLKSGLLPFSISMTKSLLLGDGAPAGFMRASVRTFSGYLAA